MSFKRTLEAGSLLLGRLLLLFLLFLGLGSFVTIDLNFHAFDVMNKASRLAVEQGLGRILRRSSASGNGRFHR